MLKLECPYKKTEAEVEVWTEVAGKELDWL